MDWLGNLASRVKPLKNAVTFEAKALEAALAYFGENKALANEGTFNLAWMRKLLEHIRDLQRIVSITFGSTARTHFLNISTVTSVVRSNLSRKSTKLHPVTVYHYAD